jgi:hypothetical protein
MIDHSSPAAEETRDDLEHLKSLPKESLGIEEKRTNRSRETNKTFRLKIFQADLS